MLFKFAVLAFPLLALCAPTSTNPQENALEKRWPCRTATPLIARVEEARPVESYLPGFVVAQDANNRNRKDSFAEFSIPAGSYGCQLEAYFPANYPITSSGNAQVYVYDTTGPLSISGLGKPDASWGYSPAPKNHVGTITFRSSPGEATRTVVNTFQCKDKLTYRFRLSSDSKVAGSVTFNQNASAGLRVVYNC